MDVPMTYAVLLRLIDQLEDIQLAHRKGEHDKVRDDLVKVVTKLKSVRL